MNMSVILTNRLAVSKLV